MQWNVSEQGSRVFYAVCCPKPKPWDLKSGPGLRLGKARKQTDQLSSHHHDTTAACRKFTRPLQKDGVVKIASSRIELPFPLNGERGSIFPYYATAPSPPMQSKMRLSPLKIPCFPTPPHLHNASPQAAPKRHKPLLISSCPLSQPWSLPSPAPSSSGSCVVSLSSSISGVSHTHNSRFFLVFFF